MKSMNRAMLAILISAGVVCFAMAANEIPAIWSLILPWLRPPYLHIVINAIIISIVAASRLRRSQAAPIRSQHLISVKTPPPAYYAAYSSPPEVREVAEVPVVYEREDRVVELRPVMVNGFEVGADAEEEVVAGDEGEDALSDSTSTYNPPVQERFAPEFQLEYSPPESPTGDVAEREITRKKVRGGASPSRAAPEEVRHGGSRLPAPELHRYSMRKSKSLKERSVARKNSPPSRNSLNRRIDAPVARLWNPIESIPTTGVGEEKRATEEEHETMESAWKRITEGEPRAAAIMGPRLDHDRGNLRKSSSLKELAIYSESPPSSGIGREASPSQDELNRRVEAFIKKVQEEIRSCRQNSSNEYIHLNTAA